MNHIKSSRRISEPSLPEFLPSPGPKRLSERALRTSQHDHLGPSGAGLHSEVWNGPSGSLGLATKSPSFKGLAAASRTTSEIKRKNRGEDTAQEVLLRRLLWKRGLRFRKNLRTLPGKPDIVFWRYRVAIFCDGDFWHGRDWEKLSAKLVKGSNPHYWVEKVRSNRERDLKNNDLLTHLGWTVLRFWESDIRRSPEAICRQIEVKILEVAGR